MIEKRGGMMGDLISRSELLKCFYKNKEVKRIPEYDCDNFPVTLSIKEIKNIIRNQTTAFNIEAVVKQIEEFYPEAEHYGFAGALADIIEIVRMGGGVE